MANYKVKPAPPKEIFDLVLCTCPPLLWNVLLLSLSQPPLADSGQSELEALRRPAERTWPRDQQKLADCV